MRSGILPTTRLQPKRLQPKPHYDDACVWVPFLPNPLCLSQTWKVAEARAMENWKRLQLEAEAAYIKKIAHEKVAARQMAATKRRQAAHRRAEEAKQRAAEEAEAAAKEAKRIAQLNRQWERGTNRMTAFACDRIEVQARPDRPHAVYILTATSCLQGSQPCGLSLPPPPTTTTTTTKTTGLPPIHCRRVAGR